MPDAAPTLNRKNLNAALWPPDAWSFMKTWAILDAARVERIYRAVDRSSQESCCLFAGNISPQLRAVAPYLVRFDKDDELTNFVLDKGWGNAWGFSSRRRRRWKLCASISGDFCGLRTNSAENCCSAITTRAGWPFIFPPARMR